MVLSASGDMRKGREDAGEGRGCARESAGSNSPVKEDWRSLSGVKLRDNLPKQNKVTTSPRAIQWRSGSVNQHSVTLNWTLRHFSKELICQNKANE